LEVEGFWKGKNVGGGCCWNKVRQDFFGSAIEEGCMWREYYREGVFAAVD